MRRAGRPGPLARSAAQRQRSTMRSGQFLLPRQSPSTAATRQRRRRNSPRMLSQRENRQLPRPPLRAAHGTRHSAERRGPLHASCAHPAPPRRASRCGRLLSEGPPLPFLLLLLRGAAAPFLLQPVQRRRWADPAARSGPPPPAAAHRARPPTTPPRPGPWPPLRPAAPGCSRRGCCLR